MPKIVTNLSARRAANSAGVNEMIDEDSVPTGGMFFLLPGIRE
jgi:hypothetical protein